MNPDESTPARNVARRPPGPHNPDGFDSLFASSLTRMAPADHSAPVLADRIRRAAAALAAAPPPTGPEITPQHAQALAAAHRAATAILAEADTPPAAGATP